MGKKEGTFGVVVGVLLDRRRRTNAKWFTLSQFCFDFITTYPIYFSFLIIFLHFPLDIFFTFGLVLSLDKYVVAFASTF